MAQILQWVTAHIPMMMTILLVLSEAGAAIVQLAFPANQGVSGFFAGLIKVLQNLGAKPPGNGS